ncbi:hypothetical protein LIER_22406 [Lithospermum erythrorhizon]|uniref:Uncharacterized protein n=1 Tax=Lithospermum erythrorhizon TaxID=34254 RepID=A0AAV3QX74_LITER
MEFTSHYRISLVKDGVIEPFVNMFNKGNLEAKLSALGALQNLSYSVENISLLIDLGIVIALLQLLFSVTSVLMTLREPASAILAKIAQSGSILVTHNVAQQMLSLLNVSSSVIQFNLLDALISIVSHTRASKVRKKMNSCCALQLLLPFLVETTNSRIKGGALELMYNLSKDMQEELIEHLSEARINTLVRIISSATLQSEKKAAAAAIGILGNIPLYHKKSTDMLVNAKILPALVSILSSTYVIATPSMEDLAERTTGLLIRFTLPSNVKLQYVIATPSNVKLQYALVSILSSTYVIATPSMEDLAERTTGSVEQGVIPVLVKLLNNSKM